MRWGAKIHSRSGDHVVVDSTPRFGSGRGLPCNDEHNEVCGGRKCEDPRGGAWSASPGVRIQVQEGGPSLGYQVKAWGQGSVTVCPPPDMRDAEGLPVRVLDGACSTVEVP